MQSFEFISKIEKGQLFIPDEIKTKLSSQVKVILKPVEHKKKTIIAKKWTAMKLKTKDFNFNRNDANER